MKSAPFPTHHRRYSVAIHCSHAPGDRSIKHALILAVIANGFEPLMEYAPWDTSCPRPELLAKNILNARYSIHECSWCLAPKSKIKAAGRYNLPIELGMASFERERTLHSNTRHQFLALVKKGHSYANHIASITGGSPAALYENEEDLILQVLNWFTTYSPDALNLKPNEVRDIWLRFQEQYAKERARVDDMRFEEFCGLLLQHCRDSGWKDPPWWKEPDTFDAFFAYNTKDQAPVEHIANALRDYGIEPWIDTDRIAPSSQPFIKIQEGMPKCKSAVIFLGPHGLGPTQQQEWQALLVESIKHGKPIIPVLLPSADREKMPLFLHTFRWVEFLWMDDQDALEKLCWGITRERGRVKRQR